MTKYQRRYVLFAKSCGKTPEEMDSLIKHNYPFMRWIQENLIQHRQENPDNFTDSRSLISQETWTQFLENQVSKMSDEEKESHLQQVIDNCPKHYLGNL